jgi:hypothetical protein
MRPWHHSAVVFVALGTLCATALGQIPPSERPPPDAEKMEKKEPGRGDFDAGGQVRLPNGPDEMGEFATFNWIALDLKGRYFVLDTVTINGNVPLAVKKPATIDDGTVDPRMIGGASVTLDAKLPMTGPFLPKSAKDNEAGILLTGAYLREGAMLLSEKDFPLFAGSFKPGFSGGLRLKQKLSSVVDFSLTPVWVYQAGSAEAAQAVQLPMSTIVALGELVKVSVDLGVYTGAGYTLRSSKGGRVSAGGAIDLKIGPILAHAGAGVASLGTGEASRYPAIGDSVYVDLNVKYAK